MSQPLSPSPISKPVIPQQPNQLAYGVQELALFKSYTRESYAAAFGTDAPLWDPSRRRKAWFDSTADISDAANVALYKIFISDPAGGWSIKQVMLPAQEAAAVNLPGAIPFPPYVVDGTSATRGGSPINATYLSLESDARALATTVGADAIVDEGATMVFPVVYPPEERRRMWAVVFHGRPLNAGLILLARNANGMGAPGQWDLTKAEPLWVNATPAPTGLDDTRPPREMPVRDLLPNEKLQTGLMGISVVRTDLAAQQAESTGQFTADDRSTLQQIYRIVTRLGI